MAYEKIEHRPWKIKFDLAQRASTAVLESLYDLMYDDTGVPRVSNSPINGWNMSHDVICFDPSIYDERYRPRGDYFEQWKLTGLDMCPAFFDPRSKPLVLGFKGAPAAYSSRKTNTFGLTDKFLVDSGILEGYRTKENDQNLSTDAVARLVHADSSAWFVTIQDRKSRSIINQSYVQGYDLFEATSVFDQPTGVTVEDRESAVFPSTVVEVMQKSAQCDEDKRDRTMIMFEGNYENPYSVVPEDMNNNMIVPDVILTDRDTVFDSTLQTKNMMGYAGIALNPRSSNIKKLYVMALNLNATNNEFSESWEISLYENPLTRWLMKHTYVWVRCMFWADYINPASFKQDLNLDANVKHGNVLLSKDSDFNRYDDSLSAAKSSTKDNYGSEYDASYVPKTAPIEDFVSLPAILAATGDSKTDWENKSWQKKIEALVEAASVPGNLIGYFHGSEVIDRHSAAQEVDDGSASPIGWYPYRELTPPTFFEPESRKLSGKAPDGAPVTYKTSDNVVIDSYADVPGEGVVPSVLPRYGNLTVEGRIVSPAIDELWVFLKKVVFGRETDASAANSTTTYAVGRQGSSTTTRKATANDTRVPTREIKFRQDPTSNASLFVQGDPISHTVFVPEGNSVGKYLQVDDWVNSPDQVQYKIFETLLDIDRDVLGYGTSTYSSVMDKTIMNFTARLVRRESDGKVYRVGSPNDGPRSPTDSHYHGLITDDGVYEKPADEWKIRNNPFSLREIEVYLKSLRYNLETLAEYISRNFVLTGDLGRRDAATGAAGSLYQLHRDYDGDVVKSNTLFSDSSTSTDDSRHPAFSNNLAKPYNSTTSTQSITYEDYHGSVPDRGNSYSAEDVYLAADGTWRYLFDQVRLPVVYSEF